MVVLLSVRPAHARVPVRSWGAEVLVFVELGLVGPSLGGLASETLERRPPRIDDLLGLPRADVCQALTGLGVETRAILATHRLKRKRQHHGVSNHRFTIHVIVVNRVVERLVTRIREKLLELDFDRLGDGVEAPHALPRGGGPNVARDEDSVVQALKSQVKIDLGALSYHECGGAKVLGYTERQVLLAHLAGPVHEVANVHAIGVRGGRHNDPS